MLNYIKALFIMLNAHRGQKDKGGKPYFFHPLRVSRKLLDEKTKIVALLHDVLEDSDKYKIDNFNFLDAEQKEALNLLTHSKDEDYFSYIEKIYKNNLARKVKIMDLEDNMNLNRLKVISSKDKERYKKYIKARNMLIKASWRKLAAFLLEETKIEDLIIILFSIITKILSVGFVAWDRKSVV